MNTTLGNLLPTVKIADLAGTVEERLSLSLYFYPFVEEGRGQLFRCPRLWEWVVSTGMMKKDLVVRATVAVLATSPCGLVTLINPNPCHFWLQ